MYSRWSYSQLSIDFEFGKSVHKPFCDRNLTKSKHKKPKKCVFKRSGYVFNHLEVVKVIQYLVPRIASTQYDIKITVEGSEPGRLYIA